MKKTCQTALIVINQGWLTGCCVFLIARDISQCCDMTTAEVWLLGLKVIGIMIGGSALLLTGSLVLTGIQIWRERRRT